MVTPSLIVILLALVGAVGIVTCSSYNPQADPAAIVTAGHGRFTVLTNRLIRMEWGEAVDTATFTVLNRLLPVPKFEKNMDGDWLVLSTDSLELRYLTTSNTTFSEKNLQVIYSAETIIRIFEYIRTRFPKRIFEY